MFQGWRVGLQNRLARFDSSGVCFLTGMESMMLSQDTTLCRPFTRVLAGDCLEIMRNFGDNSVDLIMTSSPYEDVRGYGDLAFKLQGQEWVDWALERYMECVRISRGLVVWVVEGKTRNFRWSATPALLMADLHRKGVKLRKPPVFHRVGIPGSGGPDWWRNDYEFCLASSKGKLPWSDNTATGRPPKFPPGGNPSHQSRDGRVNKPRLQREGDTKRVRTYNPPERANPGNILRCHGGGGHMGSKYAHENEAPFPESLVEPFIRCFCPPGGIVLDPFCGSGTTLAVAKKFGRSAIGIDLRQSQVDLTERRIGEISGVSNI